MPSERATGATMDARQEAPQRSADDGNPAADGSPRLGERVEYACPGCGGAANATYTDKYGCPEWLIGCWTQGCSAKRLPDLAELLGLGADALKPQIVGALRGRGRPGRRRGEPEPLPSADSIEGWCVALRGPKGARARAYLRSRGVSTEVVKQQRIGWNGTRLTLPMYDASGVLVGFKTRLPRAGADNMSIAGNGRPWPLYPAVDRSAGWVLLVAGEFDALAARSVGLPASSVTLGAGTWLEAWYEQLAGRRVRVCFDNNEELQADQRVAALWRAGVRADRLDLRTLGLTSEKGDLNEYLTGGGSARALRPSRRRVVRRNTRTGS